MDIKKTLITCLISLVTYSTFSQQLPNIVPPSPEATSLFKFTEVPMSLYAGTANISIPILEVQSGGISIPISLDYHSRGIKIGEIASRTGLGWSLNCGGMISRQMRGNYDEKPRADFNNFFTSASQRNSVYNAFSANFDLDFIPDQYYFNINGQSGKFFFDYVDNQAVIQDFSNIKITKTTSGFEIVDGKGNKYIFEQYTDYDVILKSRVLFEMGNNIENSPSVEQNINTWHLKKIITNTGKEIEFSYEIETSRYSRRSCDNYERPSLIESLTIPPTSDIPFDTENPNFHFDPTKPFGPNNLYPSTQAMYKSYSTDIESYQNRITQITFDEGKVVFEYYSSRREDLKSGGNALKSITLYDKQNVQIKKAVLDYFYTDSSAIDIASGSNSSMHSYYHGLDNAHKRLFLNSIRFFDNQGFALPPYTFEYSNTILPSRHSNSQDIWGYYNGKKNGAFLKNDGSVLGTRAVDTLKAEAGMLKKITYPEGGSTSFYYEQNRVFNKYPKSVVFESPNPVETKSTLLSNLDANFNDTPFNPSVPIYSGTANQYTKTFEIPENVAGANMEYQVHFGNSSGCGYPYNSDCEYAVTLLGINNGVNFGLYITPQNEFRQFNALPPGKYKLIVKPKSSNHNPFQDFFIIGIKWNQETILPDEPIYAGGKRINKIEYRDASNNLGLSKTYSYNDPQTGQSSGVLFGLPNFLSIHPDTNIFNGVFNIFQPFGNVPGAPLSTYQENSLGYGVVTEYLGEGTDIIGKTIYRYTMTPESNEFYSMPYHPAPDHEWMRGKPIEITYYRVNNGIFSPVKKIENKYVYGGHIDETSNSSTPAVFYSLDYKKLLSQGLENCYEQQEIELYCTHSIYAKNKKMFRIPFALLYYNRGLNTVNQNALMYKVYHLTGGAMDLLETKVTEYFEIGNKLITETRYAYNYDDHYNLSTVTQTTSDNGTLLETEYLYPSELPEMPHTQDMVAKNIVDIPLVVKSFKNSIKLSEVETIYNKWNNNFLAPQFTKTSKGSNTLESRLQYIKYDDKGNPLEVKQENGIHIVYLWGYNKAYPIAKIENATYAQVTGALGTTSISEADIGDINDLRDNSAFANAMITTYTYQPLVGVTSITDPRGYTTTYQYDNFNRLEFVRDAAGNILERTQYHYQN